MPQPKMPPSNLNFNVTKDDDEYFLSVIIGNEQYGDTTFWDTYGTFTRSNPNSQGNIYNHHIGHGSFIKGKKIKIRTDEHDVNPNSNATILSYYITNKPVPINMYDNINPIHGRDDFKVLVPPRGGFVYVTTIQIS